MALNASASHGWRFLYVTQDSGYSESFVLWPLDEVVALGTNRRHEFSQPLVAALPPGATLRKYTGCNGDKVAEARLRYTTFNVSHASHSAVSSPFVGGYLSSLMLWVLCWVLRFASPCRDQDVLLHFSSTSIL